MGQHLGDTETARSNEVREALVLDEDGQLRDVVELLREFEVDFVQGLAAPGSYAGPASRRLIVATLRHALKLEPRSAHTSADGSAPARQLPSRIAVVEGCTRTAEARLRELGFDFLVRRPVHPLALRLLLQQVLDEGEERRVVERVPFGRRVSYRCGWRRRPALLVELSRRGCRILVPKAVEPDSAITITLPKELGGGAPLSLSGWVLRCEPRDASDAALDHCLGVAFQLPPESEQALELVLGCWSEGPHALPPEQAESLAARGIRWPRPRRGPVQEHRRRSPRKRFRGRVAARRQRSADSLILVGRNLSPEGMLIESHPELDVGNQLTVSLCGAYGDRIVLCAEVLRNDGEAGLALRFERPEEEARRQLEALLSGLPSVERFVDGEPRGVATVVGEIQTQR